ncbi:SH3 domain-containing protein [Azospirillum sp.]|uniref:SH3 domain-containing protein n=1 Tax=Azospirillum sp. TaxID=34012 RepID=UPI003D70382F
MRISRFVPVLALMLAAALAACGTQSRPPPVYSPPVAKTPGFEPVAGKWVAGTDGTLRAAASPGAAVVGRLPPGQPVNVVGRVPKSDWIAVSHNGATGYIRLHMLRLQDSAAPSVKGASTVVPKAADNGGPKVNAAPRGKIEAAPIAQ